MKYGAALPTLNPRPNSNLGILVPHFGSTPGLKSRPNLGLGTSVLYINVNSLQKKKKKKKIHNLFFNNKKGIRCEFINLMSHNNNK